MFRKLFIPTLACALVAGVAAAPQGAVPPEKIDAAMNARIRTEGLDHSQIMKTLHFISDVYGPRPTGSPNQKAAAEWVVKTMTSWGMKNAHLEPFTWKGVGWLPGRASGFITSPVKANLKFEARPWSPSTKGTVSGEVVALVAPETPTEAELDAYLIKMAPRVKGGIVMVGPPPAVPVNFNEPQKRTPDDQAKARYQPDPNNPDTGRGGRGGGGGGRGNRGGGGAPAAPPEGHLSANQVSARINQLVKDNMPGLLLTAQGPGRIPGVIVAQNGAGQIYDDVTPQPPAVILRTDDYGRIFRITQDGTPVTVEFNVQNTYYPGHESYVTVGEIPGTDKADEVVMLGGHLDSWASATGATDNGIGSSIMLEAARILETVGAKPRRTIRVALWSGEEQGELGSFAYVANHFGSAENPKPEFSKLDAYWNIDDGTGRVRGASIFGPPEAAAILAQYIKPFEDFGAYGVNASTARVEGGSDNGAFAVAGLPGIGTQQDQIEYNSTTWHTNLDNYERIVPEDVMHNAVLTASVMYGLAMRDDMLPRFPADKMPPIPPPTRGGGAGPAGRNGGAGAAADAGPQATSRVFVVTKGQPFAIVAPGLIVGGGGRGGGNPTAAETAAIGTAPKSGKAVVNANGGFTDTPNAGFIGTDTFTFTVTADKATSKPATVTIIVK